MEDCCYDEIDNGEQGLKKVRLCSTSSTDTVDTDSQQRTCDLELDTVKELFQRYDLAEGDNIPCCICGECFLTSVCVSNIFKDFFLHLTFSMVQITFGVASKQCPVVPITI